MLAKTPIGECRDNAKGLIENVMFAAVDMLQNGECFELSNCIFDNEPTVTDGIIVLFLARN